MEINVEDAINGWQRLEPIGCVLEGKWYLDIHTPDVYLDSERNREWVIDIVYGDTIKIEIKRRRNVKWILKS